MDFDLPTFMRLLALALNPGTIAGEASAALLKAESLGDRNGTACSLISSIRKILASKNMSEGALEEAVVEVRSLREENCALKADVQRLEVEVEALKCAVPDNGQTYVPFGTLASSAERAYGRKTWKTAFAFEAGITTKQIAAWQTVGLAPAVWLTKLVSLTEDQRKPAARNVWTPEARTRLLNVLDQGLSDLAIAQALTAEFGVRIYESTVTNQRRQLSREVSGKRNKRSGTARGGESAWAA